jgi:hypothetical protein
MIIQEERSRLFKESPDQRVNDAAVKFDDALSEYVMIYDESKGYDQPIPELRANVMGLIENFFLDLERRTANPEHYE